MSLQLVPNADHGWKWISVHALWLAGILPSVWDTLPHQWQDRLPFSAVCIASGITAAAGIIGRFTDQGIDLTPPSTHEDHKC